jgi:hypothetical protein
MAILITFTLTIEIAPYRFIDMRIAANSPSEARSIAAQEYGDDVRITAITWRNDQ